jgi:hypothetical protein
MCGGNFPLTCSRGILSKSYYNFPSIRFFNVLRFSLSSNLKHLRYPWEASKITEILSALHPLAVSDGSSFSIPREEVFPGNGRQQNFAFM